MQSAASSPVIVVGAGWAGLACAVELTRHGIPTLVLEASGSIGGRARSVVHGSGNRVDNGQHLLLGAYHEVLTLLRHLEVDAEQVLQREGLQLQVDAPDGGSGLRLRAPRLPAPWHSLFAVLLARGLSWADKRACLGLLRDLRRQAFQLPQDTVLGPWLRTQGQTPRLIRWLWEPLCLAALNTPLEQASTRVFLAVLQRSFAARRQDSDMLVPRVPLHELLPRPALDFIRRHNGQLLTGQRVRSLVIEAGRVTALRTRTETCPVSQVVLALPPQELQRLTQPHADFTPLNHSLAQLREHAILTAYFQYPAQVRLPRTLLGLEGNVCQWLFDRRVCGQDGLIAAVSSCSDALQKQDSESVLQAMEAEIRQRFPRWPAPLQRYLVHEKRATFASTPALQALRPGHASGVTNCWLAGDFIHPTLPATLEAAVASGVQCARTLLSARKAAESNREN